MASDFIEKIRRGLRKPPHVILRRIFFEINAQVEKVISPQRAKRFNEYSLLRATKATNLDSLWLSLGKRAYPAVALLLDAEKYNDMCPGDSQRIERRAEDALEHRVDLLGSGPIDLGESINWHQDYKTGFSWPPQYFKSIDYNNPERPSDVKFPWEVSRMQWLMPAGQAYLLTGDERYPTAVRNVINNWIDNNPYANSINWSCTMEVALRILTWTWFFHVFHKSTAWSDQTFRVKFLCSLYLHADFTERHLEFSDINGNHYTADAAGLVFAGLFWSTGKAPERWHKAGWQILCEELPRQVFPDGVDFEASVPYHRLVLELFFLPAYYRQKCGFGIPEFYKERVVNMARFTAAYSRQDGSVPLWGDADDARALPFGDQSINDHRYLLGLVGTAWDVQELKNFFSGPRSEIFWLLGCDNCDSLTSNGNPLSKRTSQAFAQGGFYVMRNNTDHVFIDCGPVGMGGRGGHGHNDCLSFEAFLDGVHLISDCGAYLYTASYDERNKFRSTAYHNTPMVDNEEINRFIGRDYLWTLQNDATPSVLQWTTNRSFDYFAGCHSGYARLEEQVIPIRSISLDHQRHALIIYDVFQGSGIHDISISLHLALGVGVERIDKNVLVLSRGNERTFSLIWYDEQQWPLLIGEGHVSPSYGVKVTVVHLNWRRRNVLDSPLLICIVPRVDDASDMLQWAINRVKDNVVVWKDKMT